MTSPSSILETLRLNLPDLKRDYHVRSLSLFGSYARGEARKRSDVDILVEYDVIPGLYRFIELQMALSDLLGVKVDLVMPEALKGEIAANALAEAIPVERVN